MGRKTFLTLIGIFIIINLSIAQSGTNAVKNWHDNKYSMFIHFGVYSELGGVWRDKPVTNGYSEQIHATAGIMADVYEEVPSRFNPVNWNADSIAALAKKAGMRSIVITSKHHDGFCMYKSAFTRFNIVDATPFKRDIIKELSEACNKAGINFGLYFSLIDYTLHPFTSHNANPITPDHHEYNKKQVTELLTNYGPISEMWFDMGSLTSAQSREIYDLVHRLQPDCMVSGRLGNNAYDFCVMGDNEYPDYKIDAPWQTPASMFNETWGYRSWQKRENAPAKIHEKLLSLIKVVSRGGNYLLNIGPKGDGTVVPYEAEVLLGVGKWLDKYGEAIYSTRANPFPVFFPWGEITATENRLYLILSGKSVGNIVLPGISGQIKQASLLNDTKTIFKTKYEKNSLTVSIPESLFQNPEIQVIVLEFKGKYLLAPEQVITGNPVTLDFHNSIKYYSFSCIDYYNNYRSIVRQSWNFNRNQKSAVPLIYYTDEEAGKEIDLNWNGKTESVKLEDGEKIPANEKSEAVKWESCYSYGPVRSDFENLPGPIPDTINTNSQWSKRRPLKWNLISGGINGTEQSIPSTPLQYIFILQEIISEAAQNQLVEFGSGDGVQVWLNGENLIKHNNPRGSLMNKEIVLLPLKAGKNQLLIKFFNRYGYELNYSINSNISQILYRQKLTTQNFSGINTCGLKLRNPESEHEPLRMNNIKIQIP
jgi:alpha-L-fucosidase